MLNKYNIRVKMKALISLSFLFLIFLYHLLILKLIIQIIELISSATHTFCSKVKVVIFDDVFRKAT